MSIYTRHGDDGTTGRLYGGRVAKTSPVIAAVGAVDEAQAALGLARAEARALGPDSGTGVELDGLLVDLERDLYVLMAELSTAPVNRGRLTPGTTAVTSEMVTALEGRIDELTTRFPPLRDFVVPGHDRVSAALDAARTVVRRAERAVVAAVAAGEAGVAGSQVAPYLNRLSDLVWTMARWHEAGDSLLSRRAGPRSPHPAAVRPERRPPLTPEFVAAADAPVDAEAIGFPVFADLTVPAGAGAELDQAYARRRGFEGQPGQTLALPGPDGRVVIAVGVGAAADVDGDTLRRAGAALARQAGTATVLATTLAAAAPRPELVAAAVEGIGLATYKFAGHKKQPPGVTLQRVVVVGGREEIVKQGAVAVRATLRARDWINTPAQDLTPTRLAAIAGELASAANLSVRIWDEKAIAAERLGGLAGVAAGAEEPPRLIRLAWEPAGATTTIALVGKGITFDSGGLSLKSGAGMMTMKDDMGGAAAVLSAAAAAAELELPVRVVAWVAATENMPSGTAIHPGDVLVARNGTSIEVLNTDAEGRLVLADGLSLAIEEQPDVVLDVATLTGAQRIALGNGVAAVMGNDDDVVARVIAAGETAGEPFWRLPLVAAYRRLLDSDVADIKNIASSPGGAAPAGTIIAGLFLQEFVGDARWAHLDIAAPAWSESDEGWLARGATGWATRTLLELVRGYA